MTGGDTMTELKRSLEERLGEAGRRADAALRAYAAAVAEIGHLLREDETSGHLVGLRAAEAITGLPHDALVAARADTTSWEAIRRRAASAITYGNDHGDQDAIHAYYPQIAGLWWAAEWLQQRYATTHGQEPDLTREPPVAPGYEELIDYYYDLLRRIADED